ncbi:MAG: uracil phosphoribosyltransferase, partial [Verrucomicrobiales bacterium]
MSAGDHPGLTIVDHPGIRTRLTRLRERTTPPPEFRRALHEISQLMAFELTRDLETLPTEIETPLERTAGEKPARPLVLVPVLRAGLGMLQGFLDIFPEALVGHIGMFRNEQTLEPESYYRKLPPRLDQADVILIDPMLATGGSGAEALSQLVNEGATRLRFLCLISAPEGIAHLRETHPEVPVYT